MVHEARSYPERPEQLDLVHWVACSAGVDPSVHSKALRIPPG